MFEKYVCPECWAFQDPNTGKCLVCGKRHIQLCEKPISLAANNEPQWYSVPVKWQGRDGIVTFFGKPSFEISNDKGVRSACLKFDVKEDPDCDLMSMFIG